MPTPHLADVDPAWLPPEAFRAVGSRRSLLCGDGPLIDTVHAELAMACQHHGGGVRHATATSFGNGPVAPYDLVLALVEVDPPAGASAIWARARAEADALGDEGFLVARGDGVTVVLAQAPAGLLYGLFHLVRSGESAFGADHPARRHRPAMRRRMLDHWDNVDVHPVMGQVERGYAGGSIFWRDGRLRSDLTRVRAYARLLAACGVNAVALNNVNVHATEARQIGRAHV